MLGRGRTQEKAVTELLELAPDDLKRGQVLQLLVNWRVTTAVGSAFELEEQELMATLSQAYLDWEQQTLQRGHREGLQEGRKEGEIALVKRLLTRKFGHLPANGVSKVESLSLEQLELLGDVLLDFDSLADLNAWLESNP